MLLLWFAPPAFCTPPTVTLRNTFALPGTAVDQFGQTFTIAGLSGVTRLHDDAYAAVMDNSNHLIFLTVQLAANGAISSAQVTGGFTLPETHDFEGIAAGRNVPNIVFVAEEDTPAVRVYDLNGGAVSPALEIPPVFANRRPNFGFESLARTPAGRNLWTANEEALTVDGPQSSPTNGTTVRLLQFSRTTDSYAPVAQFAYLTEPMHGGNVTGGRSGVSDLVALPDGGLLVLERSFAFNLAGFFRNRIFYTDLAGATDVSSIPALQGATYTPASKTLLFSGNLSNLEGLTLGPALGPGRWALLGIVDNGDPLSSNQLVAFELAGAFVPADLNCDGAVNNFDIDPFVLALSDPGAYHTLYPDCPESAADVNHDSAVNNFDIDAFVACLIAGGCL